MQFSKINTYLLHIDLHPQEEAAQTLIQVPGQTNPLLTATVLNDPVKPEKVNIEVHKGDKVLLPVSANLFPLNGQLDGRPGEYLVTYADVMAVLEDENPNTPVPVPDPA